MISAAVGFQCPECVRAGSAGTREARSVLGARTGPEVSAGAGEWVTRVLVAVQLAVFLLASVLGRPFVVTVGLVGTGVDTAGGAPVLVGVEQGQLWRLVTASLLVATGVSGLGLLSLVFSLLITYLFGRQLEPDLGRWRFLALWLVSAVASNAVALLALPTGALTYGAQGASFGLLAAAVVVARRLRQPVGGLLVLGGIWVVLGLFGSPSSWYAAGAGALIGAGLAVVSYAPRERRDLAFWSTAGVVLGASIALALLG